MARLIEAFRVSHRESVSRLFFSPDGAILVSSSKARSVLWDGRGRPILEIDHEEEALDEDALDIDSFDGRGASLVVPGSPGRVVDLSSGGERALPDSPSRWIKLELSPDGGLIGGVSRRDGVKVWTSSDLRPHLEVPAYRSGGHGAGGWSEHLEPHDISFRRDGRYLLVLGRGRHAEWGVARHHGENDEIIEDHTAVAIWDLESRTNVSSFGPGELDDFEEIETHSPAAIEGLFSEDSSTIAIRLEDDTILRLDAEDLSVKSLIVPPPPVVERLYLSADGSRVVAIDEERTARLWSEHGERTTETTYESIRGYVTDPRNGFGLPVGREEPPPRYRILGSEGMIVVEAWPERRTIVAEPWWSPGAIAVQPGSNSRAFAVSEAGGEGEIALLRLEP